MKRIVFSEEAQTDIRAIPQFTFEHPDTLRIHTVKNRKEAYR